MGYIKFQVFYSFVLMCLVAWIMFNFIRLGLIALSIVMLLCVLHLFTNCLMFLYGWYVVTIEDRLKDKRIKIELTNDARDFIINNSYDVNYGARPIKRYVGRNIETLIANNIINDNIKYNSDITIDINNDKFIIKNLV